MRRVLAGVLAGVLVGSVAVAQTPDLDRAKELYTVARKALDDGRHADAIRDFGAAYDITKDPVMFYWIGNANAQAGKCDVALIYYGRYLKEGKPSDDFLVTVRQRITACGGDTSGSGSGSAVVEPAGSGSAPAGSGAIEPAGSGSADVPVAVGSGSASGSAVAAPIRAKNQGPWLLVGGSIAMLTVGVVLAYSANASENDISDLYVGLEGNPPVFDDRTKQRYDDLIAEGERYEKLSWASFAVAAGLAGGAAIWFYRSRGNNTETSVITPTVQKDGAGVSATVRW
jgi:hypothetical protein